MAEAIFLLGVARLLIRFVAFRRILGWIDRLFVGSPQPATPDLHGFARIITSAARNVPWRALCLEQALAGRMMLGRRGIASTLHLGVVNEAGRMEAHAWLECAGVIWLGGEVAPEYTPVARFGAPDS